VLLLQRPRQALHRERGGRPGVRQPQDAHAARQVDVGPAPCFRGPGLEYGAVLAVARAEEVQEAQVGEVIQPGRPGAGLRALVVPLHGEHGNARIAQAQEDAGRLPEGLRIHGPLVEKIPGQEQQVGPLGDGGVDEVVERRGKVVVALHAPVLGAAEVDVRGVDEA